MGLKIVFAGCLCCLYVMQPAAQEKMVSSGSEVSLSETRPVVRIPLPANIRAAPAAILEVPIIGISNPRKMSFSIFAYVEWNHSAPGPTESEKVLLGNFTVYPPDQPGSYTMRVSTAFEKLKATGTDLSGSQAVVMLEVKRTNPSQPWSPVNVVIGQLRWRSNNP